jgi:putative oxidoreductase
MRDGMMRWHSQVARQAGRVAWLPPLLARVSVGLLFLQTGWGKLTHLDRVIEFFARLGIPLPHVQAPLVAGLEAVCGTLLVLGLLTRLASLPLIAIMAVALATAKAGEIQGVTDLFGLSEYLYAVLLVWLAIAGPGKISVDHVVLHQGRSAAK